MRYKNSAMGTERNSSNRLCRGCKILEARNLKVCLGIAFSSFCLGNSWKVMMGSHCGMPGKLGKGVCSHFERQRKTPLNIFEHHSESIRTVLLICISGWFHRINVSGEKEESKRPARKLGIKCGEKMMWHSDSGVRNRCETHFGSRIGRIGQVISYIEQGGEREQWVKAFKAA